MAKIIRRQWTSTGPMGKCMPHVAFGSLMPGGAGGMAGVKRFVSR